MPNVGIVADTTASIPEELARELQIELVPYYVVYDGKSWRDMVDLHPDAFAEYLGRATTLPTTACPSSGDYLDAFKRLAERTRDIVALTMTGKGSGGYASAQIAVDTLRAEMPHVNIQLVDTLQAAMCYGWAVIAAARSALQGLTLDRVVEHARQTAQQAMMLETADTLRYLYMGGRIGRAQHLAGSLLNIKPLIGMQDGVIVALGVARGRPRAYARMAELAQERFGAGTPIRLALTHCAALKELELLKSEMLKRFTCAELLVTALSPVLAVHSGPGTVGMCIVPA
ncbi:MAG: DegV family protein [Anaerolineae bacterium]